MVWKVEAVPGCCTGLVVGDLGGMHGINRSEDIKEFINQFLMGVIKAFPAMAVYDRRSIIHCMFAGKNIITTYSAAYQKHEEEFLKELGFNVGIPFYNRLQRQNLPMNIASYERSADKANKIWSFFTKDELEERPFNKSLLLSYRERVLIPSQMYPGIIRANTSVKAFALNNVWEDGGYYFRIEDGDLNDPTKVNQNEKQFYLGGAPGICDDRACLLINIGGWRIGTTNGLKTFIRK